MQGRGQLSFDFTYSVNCARSCSVCNEVAMETQSASIGADLTICVNLQFVHRHAKV